MTFLAISGSARSASTNLSLLRGLQAAGRPDYDIVISDDIADLPIFSPDREMPSPPPPVVAFINAVAVADALIISSPEYVRAIPGGLKNAIDWLVSRNELTGKPIVLVHASHRGDDMLQQLRLVLATVSDKFNPDIFLRRHLMNFSPAMVAEELAKPQHQEELRDFLRRLASFVLE